MGKRRQRGGRDRRAWPRDRHPELVRIETSGGVRVEDWRRPCLVLDGGGSVEVVIVVGLSAGGVVVERGRE